MNKPQVGDQFELYIDRLSYDGGRGVGRHEGFVFFVPDTAPDEHASVEVVEVKKNYGTAKILKILKPSRHRREPPCPVAGRCGGCVWQHIEYKEQINQKQMLLKHHLRNFVTDEQQIRPVIPSPNEFRYRHRIQIQVETRPRGASESPAYGFFAAGSNDLVNVKDCLISDSQLFESLDLSQEFINAVEIARQHEQNKKFTKIELAMDSQNKRHIRPLARDESEFTQANFELNKELQNYVIKIASDFFEKTSCQNKSVVQRAVYDLYCGSGNFSFSLLDSTDELNLIGVELNSAAIQRAKAQYSQAKYDSKHSKAEFIASDVGSYLKTIKKIEENAIFLVDPPRAGLDKKTLHEILRLKPKLIIYVSCSLPSLSRDLRDLTGYKIIQACGFDMFPQTEYLETVVVLERNV